VAHIERRCARGHAVPRGRGCGRCGSAEFSYRVRYLDPDGRERSKSFKRKADAEDFGTEVSHALRSSSYVDPAAGRQTLKAYLEEWRAMQAHHRKSTADGARTRFRTMVYPYIGDVPLGRLRPSTAMKWQAALVASGKYAPATIKVTRGVVAGALNDAVRDRRLASNPFDGVKSVEPDRQKVVPRTMAQVEAGRLLMPDHLRAVIRFDAGTGLRYGEVFGLTVDRVGFLRRELTVDRQLIGRRGRTPIFGPPKTPASVRTVPFGDTVATELAEHLRAYPARPGQAIWRERGGRETSIEHEGLVFTTSIGTPMTRGMWIKSWHGARDAMGLKPGEGLHHLRHFYASLLIAAGRSVIEVQERLGHESAQETLDTYSHLFEDAPDGTRKAIDDAFGRFDEQAGPGVAAAE
jgi:integrase